MTILTESWGLPLTILLAAVVSDAWRVMGAFVAARIDERSVTYRLVKAVATALIAAIIARLTIYPTGAMGEVPLSLRIGSMGLGLVAYLAARRSMVVGTAVSEIALAGGIIMMQPG